MLLKFKYLRKQKELKVVNNKHTGSSGLRRKQSSRQWWEAKQRKTTAGGWGKTGLRWGSGIRKT